MRTAFAALLLVAAAPLARAEVKLTPKSNADDVLVALQEVGQTLADFTASVRHVTMDPFSLHETITTGKVLYQRLPDADARIRVIFERKKAGSLPEVKWHREYSLAKGELIDQDFDAKSETHHQVLKPGQKMNPLKLGEGPFPLPIGQDPAEVKKSFDVSISPHASDDPAGTVHAQLKPKPDTRFAKKFDLIEVWVEIQSHFPTRIQVTEKDGNKVVTSDLKELHINAGLKDADFTLAPHGQDWSFINEALED